MAIDYTSRELAIKHIFNDINYPAQAEDIKSACNNMSDVPSDAREEIIKNLPEGRYLSAEQVLEALGWEWPNVNLP